MKTFKSIGAVVIGLVVSGGLSALADTIYQKTGFMTLLPVSENSVWILLTVVLTGFVCNILGGYINACIAPNKPMKHALIQFGIAFLFTLIGTIMWRDVPPHYYPILVTLSSLGILLGAKIYIKSHTGSKK